LSERQALIRAALTHLRESKVRLAMGQRGFSFTLLEWAGNARRRAAALSEPRQQRLF
jgi:hypothetical protein